MSATKATPPQAAKALTDDPDIEAQSVRGLLYGLLIAALFWILIVGLTLTLF